MNRSGSQSRIFLCPARGGSRCRRGGSRRRDGVGAVVRRWGSVLNGAGELRRNVGALGPGGEAWPGVGGVVRGVGAVGTGVRRQVCALNGAGALRRGVGALGPGGEAGQCPAARRGPVSAGGRGVGTMWGRCSAGCSEASERWNRCAAAGECLEWSGRVATGSWSVGARRRGEAVPGVGGVVRGVGTVGNMYAEVLRWLCLLCARVSDCTWRPGLCCCGMLSCG